MSDLRFRPGDPGDADALTALGRASFTETFGHLYAPEDLAAFLVTHQPDKWRAELASPDFAVLVGEAEGALAAYAKLGPLSLPFKAEKRPIELRQFYLLKPWHGKGHAERMMDWVLAEARARGASDIYLSVFVDNHRARRFYERYGFTFVQPYAFMVGNHADEDHILRLRLESE